MLKHFSSHFLFQVSSILFEEGKGKNSAVRSHNSSTEMQHQKIQYTGLVMTKEKRSTI